MRIWILAVSLVFVGVVFSKQASAGCIQDSDCKKKQLCHVGRCTKLSKKESLLDVNLEEWVANAALFVDGTPMGNLPWQGIVPAGAHTIRIEAPGYQVLEVSGTARGGQREPIVLRLEPSAGGLPPTAAPSQGSALPPPPPPGQYDSGSLPPPSGESYDYSEFEGEEGEAGDEGEGDSGQQPGMLAIGVHGNFGYGTAMWDNYKRPTFSVFGGGLFSVRFMTDPIWFELGLTGSYGGHFVKNWPQNDGTEQDVKVTELHVGLLPRILFSLVDNFFYLGGEIEAGMAISSDYYLLVQARVDLAFMVNEWLEIRINPAGFEFLQELGFQGAFVGYTGNIGAAFRFL